MRSIEGKIVIIGDSIGLPTGYAASTRTTNIALALSEAGANVEILLIKPSETVYEIKNTESKGFIKNIPFSYTCGETTHSKNWFGRRFQAIEGFLTCANILIHQRKNISTVIFYSRNIEVVFPLNLLCKFIGVTCVLELCEWPVTQSANSKLSAFKKRLFCKYSLSKIDGVIYISQYIKNCVERYETKKNKFISKYHLPILSDSSEFEVKYNNGEPIIDYPYFLYCGNLSYLDLLFKTLECMSLVFKSKPAFKLIIVGSSDNEEHKIKLEKRIFELGITNEVILKGFVSKSQLINLYKSAYSLILPLDDDALSNARFPTKLSEYLLSARPVVVSNTGEIGMHLLNNISAYIPEDCSIEGFTERALHAINNPEEATLVGQTGKAVALKDFNYKTYAHSLLEWINKLAISESK
jgi:glycosyltransferase involved in cell wall biosynthesis